MALPTHLQSAISDLISKIGLQSLGEYSQELSKRYHQRSSPIYMNSRGLKLAYLTARFPATFGVIERILRETKARTGCPIHSLLDVGAGPGTGFWGAMEVFSEIKKATMIERDKELIEIGKYLMSRSSDSLPWILWQERDLEKGIQVEAHDLVLFSYALGEIKESSWEPLLQTLWNATSKIFIVIEPGTPEGFSRVRKARQMLLDLGANLIAPCPHKNACPLLNNDWCHFSERITRSFEHRFVKDASLNFEDEKFSYLVFSKTDATPSRSRILRHPMKHSGHVRLTLCAEDGVKNTVVSRKDKESYLRARKVKWGEEF